MKKWPTVSLGDVVELQRGYDLPEQERHAGPFPIVGSAGPNGSHERANVKAPGVVIGRSGAGFGSAHYCDTDFWALNTGLFVKNFRHNHPKFVFYLLDDLDFTKYNSGGAQPSLNRNFIYPIQVHLPSWDEQEKIADLLSRWDTATQKTEQLIAAKERHYSRELSRLISRGQHHPHAHVDAFAEEISVRNRGGNEARVLSVTNSRGFVLPEDQFERRVASADLSNYKVVRRGQYAYNPSRINVGSIARLDGWDDGVLSPMYVVFRLDEAKVDSDYFLHWLNSHEARQRIKNSAQGSVRETVSFSEFSALTIPLPDTVTQAGIARYLNALREEIDLLGQSVAALKTQKRGLMQKLLTGQWRLPVQEEAS
ncbi:MAG: restriction endonuclease subunit S [Acidithiobacillus sp.]